MKKIIFSSQEEINLISQTDITFCKSDSCYTTVYLSSGNEFVVCKSLHKITQELDSSIFIRASQSYLINIDYIRTIYKKEKVIVMKNDVKIPFTLNIKTLLANLTNSLLLILVGFW